MKVSFKDDAENADVVTSAAFPAGTDTILAAAECDVPTYTGGARELWHATLTIGTDAAGKYGFDTRGASTYGAISPDEFTLAATTYTVEQAIRQRSGSDRSTTLGLDVAMPSTVTSKLVLYECATPMVVSDGTSSNANRDVTWTATDAADWSTYATRTLRLSHDDQAPTLASHELVGAVITLTFSETLDAVAVPTSSAFTVQVKGTDAALATTSPVTLSGTTVQLTLATAPALGDEVTLQYRTPSTNPLRDLRGNEVGAFGPLEVGYEGPIFVSAKLDGTSLKLTFHEVFDESKVPGGAAFDVRVGGTAAPLASSDPVDVSGDSVTLTLATAPRGQRHRDGAIHQAVCRRAGRHRRQRTQLVPYGEVRHQQRPGVSLGGTWCGRRDVDADLR